MGQAADELSATGVSPYGAAGGTPSAEELRAQIERQRSELGRDLEVLGDKVSPGRMVERRREAVRQSARGFKDRLMGAKDSATSRVSDTAGSVTGSVTGSVSSAGSSVGNALGSVGNTITSAPQSAMETAQGAPIAVGLVAFGAGAIIASLLPTSEKERKLGEQATPALQKAAEEAGHIAGQAVEELKPMAQEAAEAVKSTAQDAAQQVKEQASSATEEVRGTAQGATEEVKGAAQSGQSPTPQAPAPF